MNRSDKTFADKSFNTCQLTKEEYIKMGRNAITSTYKKTNNNTKKRIDIKGKQIMENVDKRILDLMNIHSKNTCFITSTLFRMRHRGEGGVGCKKAPPCLPVCAL